MTNNQINKTLKLQLVLQNLHLATPRRTIRPIFDTESEVLEFIDRVHLEGHRNVTVRPVWNIDYENLENSSIRAWSVGGKLS